MKNDNAYSRYQTFSTIPRVTIVLCFAFSTFVFFLNLEKFGIADYAPVCVISIITFMSYVMISAVSTMAYLIFDRSTAVFYNKNGRGERLSATENSLFRRFIIREFIDG